MNYTKQIAITENDFVGIEEALYKCKLSAIEFIENIVKGNGGEIDLSKKNEDGSIDYTTHSICHYSPMGGMEYAYHLTEYGIYFHLPDEDEPDIFAEYEDMDTNTLVKILTHLFHYHIVHKTVT
jgi:hypothetical protein